MIYGDLQIHVVTDNTDRVGLRTLILSQLWQPATAASIIEVLAQKPNIPEVPGGVEFIGEETKRDRGAMRTFWTFEGINGDGKSVTFKGRNNSPDYSFEPGFSQTSLIKHINWQALKKAWNGQVLDGQVFFPEFVSSNTGASGPVVADTSNNAVNPLFGHVDFFRMEGTYSFRYLATDYTVNKKAIGKIAAALPGRPPTFSNRNWLFASAPFQRRGPVVEITEVYWLSGEGGWPPQIYTDNPAATDKVTQTPTLALS